MIPTAALIAACAGGATLPPDSEPDPDRARAALATLHVDNQTTARLDILYRPAVRSGATVGIGYVDPAATSEMAPVPAGEPLILIARTATGGELELPPRTFAIDGVWTWRIARTARFTRPRSGRQ
jgi:hypothetical protein